MNPGYKRFATSDRANLERDRTKLIPHAVLPRFLAQHVCHGPGLGFFRGVHTCASPSRIQCLKDSERFVFDPKNGEIKSLPLFFSDRSLDVGHCLGNCGKTQSQSMVLRERRWKKMKNAAQKWRNLFQTTRACLQLINWLFMIFFVVRILPSGSHLCYLCIWLQVPITVLGLFVSAWLQSRAWGDFSFENAENSGYWCPKKKSTAWPLGLSVSLIFFILLFLLFFDVFMCKCSMV